VTDEGFSISIDRQVCMGTGACEAYDPDHFELDDGGIAVWIDAEPTPGKDDLIEVANLCPNAALHVLDRTGAVVG
jgi:ferredoxin